MMARLRSLCVALAAGSVYTSMPNRCENQDALSKHAARKVWEMSTVTEIDLRKSYTAEERDALFDALMDACEAGDREEERRLLRQMPIHPRWAKIIADVIGKEFLLKHFNITYANEVHGEGWLDGK